MKKMIFSILFIIFSVESSFCKDRERVIFGLIFGRSYSSGHYENKWFKFGEFYGCNAQFYFSRYFGIKLELIRQEKEAFYWVWVSENYSFPRHEKWDDSSLIIDIVLKYPKRYVTPYLTLGFGGSNANGGGDSALPFSPIGKAGAKVKIGGRIQDLLIFSFNFGVSYYTNYQDNFLNVIVKINNNQRWSIPVSIELGF